MKIVQANNYLVLRGGSERVMFDERSYLKAAGCQVYGFGPREAGAITDGNDSMLPEITQWGQSSGLAKVAAAGRIVYNVDVKRHFSQLLRRDRPDIVHGHNIYGRLTTAVIDAASECGVPFLLTLHDFKLACPSYLMLAQGQICERCKGRHFYHCLTTRCHKDSLIASLITTVEAYFNALTGKYKRACLYFAPSRFLAGIMTAAGVDGARIRHLPNGVDVNAVQSCAGDDNYVLYVGRLSKEKGLYTLLKSARGGAFRLKIVGTGPEAQALRSLAQTERLTNVEFEGYQSGAALAELMQGAATVVVPSEWYENASMTVLEAMALGKPLVAARIGGIPEQVAEGETGLLFDPGKAEELGDALTRLLRDKELRQQMGRASRARAEREFSLESHCKQLLAYYHEAIEAT